MDRCHAGRNSAEIKQISEEPGVIVPRWPCWASGCPPGGGRGTKEGEAANGHLLREQPF